MSWRIYYDDDSVGSPDSPIRTTGVVAIAQADFRTGRQIITGGDWYYLKDGQWFAADNFGIMDQVLHFFDSISCIAQGRMLPRDLFDTIQQRACDDPGLPRKSAHRRGELK